MTLLVPFFFSFALCVQPCGHRCHFVLVLFCFPGIRQLQLMLMKIALIVGVEVHVNIEFVKLLEPPDDQGSDGDYMFEL